MAGPIGPGGGFNPLQGGGSNFKGGGGFKADNDLNTPPQAPVRPSRLGEGEAYLLPRGAWSSPEARLEELMKARTRLGDGRLAQPLPGLDVAADHPGPDRVVGQPGVRARRRWTVGGRVGRHGPSLSYAIRRRMP